MCPTFSEVEAGRGAQRERERVRGIRNYISIYMYVHIHLDICVSHSNRYTYLCNVCFRKYRDHRETSAVLESMETDRSHDHEFIRGHPHGKSWQLQS